MKDVEIQKQNTQYRMLSQYSYVKSRMINVEYKMQKNNCRMISVGSYLIKNIICRKNDNNTMINIALNEY